MEARIDARVIYQPLARRFGISAAKIAVALRQAEITAADHSILADHIITPAQARLAAGILNIPAVKLNELYAVAGAPLGEPGTIVKPGEKAPPLYEPAVPVRVPYKVYGAWVFNFLDGRKETVPGGHKLTGEQMSLVRQFDRRGVNRTHDCVDEMELDREGISIEFTEGGKCHEPKILSSLDDYLTKLGWQTDIVVAKGLLIGSFGWGCFADGDDIDFVMIAERAGRFGPEHLAGFWTGNNRLALRVNSLEQWRQAEQLRNEFLSGPANDYDAAGFAQFKADYQGKYPPEILTLAWYSDYIEVEPSAV